MAFSPQEEFVHPVIEAMNNAYSLISREKQQKIKNALDQKDADLRQAQLDEVKRQHDAEQKNADNQFSINKALLEIHQRQASFDRAKSLQQLIAGGATPQSDVTSIPTAPPGSGVPTLDVQNPDSAHLSMLPDVHFNPNEYKTQDQLSQAEVAHAGNLETAKLSAAEPFKVSAENRVIGAQAAQEGLRFTREAGVHAADRASAERVATMKDATDRFLGVLNARTRLAVGASGLDSNDPAIDNYVNDMYVTGNTDKIPTNVKLQGAIRGSVPKGWTPLNKKDGAQLDGVPLVQNLLDKANQLADLTSGFTGKAKQFLGLGEAGNVAGEVNGMMGNLARIFGGEKGVLTERDITRAKGLINDIKQGGEGNKQKVADLRALFTKGISELAAKYPEDQRQAIFSKRNIDISDFTTSGSTKPGQSLGEKYGY